MKRVLLALLLLLVLLTGCGGSGPTTITVFAASSLTDVMAELATRYGQTHRGVTVQASYGGSQELAAELKQGQPADVLVTADTASMDAIARLVERRRIIAHNTMTIAVAPGNPLHVKSVADLAGPRLRVALGAPSTPSGRYAQELFAKAGVTVVPKSEEIDVRTVLTQVRTGQADAGIVYVTDIASAGAAAASVPIPAAQNVIATYPAAVVRKTADEDSATTFVTWLTSPEATAILRTYGFQ